MSSLCEVQIERENGFNVIKGIEKVRRISEDHIQTYIDIRKFLEIFQILYTFLPDTGEYKSIFEDIEVVFFLESITAVHSEFYTLVQARILKKLGYLDRSRFEKTHLYEYLYDKLEKVPIHAISKSKPLDPEMFATLTLSIQEVQHRILYHP